MQLISVNQGSVRAIQNGKASGVTGIYKVPTTAALRVTANGLEGDFISDLENHGGADQAIYIYGAEDYAWWAKELGVEPEPGTFGENLTISGVESAHFSIGDRLRIQDVILEVSAPRIPCETLAVRMNDPQFVKKFRRAERPGMLCRVIQEGIVQAGMAVTCEPFAGETLTILEMFRDWYQPQRSQEAMRRYLRAPVAARARARKEEQINR